MTENRPRALRAPPNCALLNSWIVCWTALVLIALMLAALTPVGARAAARQTGEDQTAECDPDIVGGLQKAAIANHPGAQFDLAMLYAFGACLPEDSVNALVLLHAAARSGTCRFSTSDAADDHK